MIDKSQLEEEINKESKLLLRYVEEFNVYRDVTSFLKDATEDKNLSRERIDLIGENMKEYFSKMLKIGYGIEGVTVLLKLHQTYFTNERSETFDIEGVIETIGSMRTNYNNDIEQLMIIFRESLKRSLATQHLFKKKKQ